MNVFVQRHRAEQLMAVFLLCLTTGLSIWAYRKAATGMCWCLALVGSALTAFYAWLGTVVETVSETGVQQKALFFSKRVPWSQIHRVEAVRMNMGRGGTGWYLSVTWLSKPRNPDAPPKIQGFLFPYSEPMRSALVRFYGPLDAEKTD